MGETPPDTAESENLSMRPYSNRENREIPLVSDSLESERSANVSGGKADMHAGGKSHGSEAEKVSGTFLLTRTP